MPQILRIYGFVFYFFSNDHEPIHVHVKGKGSHARFELVPVVRMTNTTGFKTKELKQIRQIIDTYKDQMIQDWHTYFGDK
jgi:hypothetical protein